MKLPVLLFTSIFLPLLTGCGGDTLVAEGGIGGTGVTMGKVSSFGSIFVNGVEYEIDNAYFTYEGETSPLIGDDSQIKVGMFVRITGSDDGVTGEADTVEYADLLEGPISSNNIDTNETGTLVAMGQTITVDPDTVYDDGGFNTLLSQLPVGAEIETSGFSDGNGNILATRVETKSLTYAGEVEVKGFVSELDVVPNTFLIGSLIIDYSSISLPDGIADGIYVEAKGILPSATAITLEASEVEIEGDGDLSIAEDGEEAELEGIVSEILDSSSLPNVLFVLNGQQVLVDADTEYESGGDASNIIVAQTMEAEGIMNGDTLIASKIELKVSSEEKEELKAAVDEVTTSDSTFMLLGQAVRVTASTIFENEQDSDQYFNLDSLTAGDFVEVDLYEDSDGSLVASKLERVSDETLNYAEIEGVVDSVESATMITVLNISVDISALTSFSPKEGDRVDISGEYAGNILTATSGEIEEQDE